MKLIKLLPRAIALTLGAVLFTQLLVASQAPVVTLIEVHNGVVNESLSIAATASDTDGNLDQLLFYINYPNDSQGYIPALGNPYVSISGYTATGVYSFIPSSAGTYKVTVGVKDNTELWHPYGTELVFIFEVAATNSAPTVTINSIADANQYIPMEISASISDANENLSFVKYWVKNVNITSFNTWQLIEYGGLEEQAIDQAGGSSSVKWIPPLPSSTWEFKVEATDYSNATTSSSVANVLVLPVDVMELSNLTVANAEQSDFVMDGIIQTRENLSSDEVVIESGGDSIFYSNLRIHLKPGFRAEQGSIFFAQIDSDMDGWTDMQEIVDSDGDGILDGFEYELINYKEGDAFETLADVSSLSDFDGDSDSDLTEFLNGTDPFDGITGGFSFFSLGIIYPDSSLHTVDLITFQITDTTLR